MARWIHEVLLKFDQESDKGFIHFGKTECVMFSFFFTFGCTALLCIQGTGLQSTSEQPGLFCMRVVQLYKQIF
jgi:hypothetical protein